MAPDGQHLPVDSQGQVEMPNNYQLMEAIGNVTTNLTFLNNSHMQLQQQLGTIQLSAGVTPQQHFTLEAVAETQQREKACTAVLWGFTANATAEKRRDEANTLLAQFPHNLDPDYAAEVVNVYSGKGKLQDTELRFKSLGARVAFTEWLMNARKNGTVANTYKSKTANSATQKKIEDMLLQVRRERNIQGRLDSRDNTIKQGDKVVAYFDNATGTVKSSS